MTRRKTPRRDQPGTGPDYLDVAEVAILALDSRGRVKLINRKGCEILGYGSSEIVGKNWFDSFIPERQRDEIRGVYEQLMNGELEPVEYFENPVVTSSGGERLIAWHNALLRDDRGKIIGTLSSGEDITERRKVEEELERSHKELADIKYALDQAAIVAITDQRGIIHYANDKFCEISKYSREELLGQDHRIVNSRYHPKEFMRDLWRTIASGRVWRGEIRNRAKDGTYYWVDTTIVPFLNEKGQPYQYLAIHSDITARKKAEEELRRREALAQLGQMAAVIAHEVKNPLAGIGGAIQIIGGRLATDSPDRQVIGSILQRIDSLNARVRDLLLFARPQPPRFGPVRLQSLLQDTANLLSRDPKLGGVQVAVSGDDVSLSGDAELLKDVFFNLLLNAAQSMGGSGRIQVNLEASDSLCQVNVRDHGPGIPAESRERIFEPFFTTKSQGTGLGLSIAKNVVEAHGGEIAISSSPGGGTTVTVSLPLREVQDSPAPAKDKVGGQT